MSGWMKVWFRYPGGEQQSTFLDEGMILPSRGQKIVVRQRDRSDNITSLIWTVKDIEWLENGDSLRPVIVLG